MKEIALLSLTREFWRYFSGNKSGAGGLSFEHFDIVASIFKSAPSEKGWNIFLIVKKKHMYRKLLDVLLQQLYW